MWPFPVLSGVLVPPGGICKHLHWWHATFFRKENLGKMTVKILLLE